MPSHTPPSPCSHPDREIWLDSYWEEKHGIESIDTYRKITLEEYCALRKKGAPKAIPTMCVLTIKKDKNLLTLHAKSRILTLGNLEERIWSKSNCFAPVLCQDSLCLLTSLAVEKRRPLRQGDCKKRVLPWCSPARRNNDCSPSLW